MITWRFATMLANLKGDGMAFVCQGPSGRGGGIVSCALTNMEGHYDPKCSRKDGAFRTTWDRSSGGCCGPCGGKHDMAEFMFFGGVSLFGPQSATRAWSQTAVAAYQSLTKGS